MNVLRIIIADQRRNMAMKIYRNDNKIGPELASRIDNAYWAAKDTTLYDIKYWLTKVVVLYNDKPRYVLQDKTHGISYGCEVTYHGDYNMRYFNVKMCDGTRHDQIDTNEAAQLIYDEMFMNHEDDDDEAF